MLLACVRACVRCVLTTYVGHGEDGELRDGAVLPDDPPRALVDRRQVRVHVALGLKGGGGGGGGVCI